MPDLPKVTMYPKLLGPVTEPSGTSGLVGRWFKHEFIVSPQQIMSFSALQIKSAVETENKEYKTQRWTKVKNAKPDEVSLTVLLSAHLGCDVRHEIDSFTTHARKGKKDYFYLGNQKLTPNKLRLVECTAKDIEIGANGTWTRATLQLSFKQGSKLDGTKIEDEKKTSKKASARTSSTTTSKKKGSTGKSGSGSSSNNDLRYDPTTGVFWTMSGGPVSGSTGSKKSTQQAAESAKKTVTSAKKNTAAKKKTTSSTNRAKRYKPSDPGMLRT